MRRRTYKEKPVTLSINLDEYCAPGISDYPNSSSSFLLLEFHQCGTECTYGLYTQSLSVVASNIKTLIRSRNKIVKDKEATLNSLQSNPRLNQRFVPLKKPFK